MDILKVASSLDKSGHYELSDKLFSIAQNREQAMRNLFTPEFFRKNLFK